MNVLGIDPGLVTTGLALFRDGKLAGTHAVKGTGALEALSKLFLAYEPLVVMEDSREQTAVWGAKGQVLPVRLRYARSVGCVDCMCALIEHHCAEYHVALIKVSPLAKGKKLTEAQYWALLGKEGDPVTEHERDAYQIAWPYRYTAAA